MIEMLGTTQSYSEHAASYDRVRFSGRSGRFNYEQDRRIIRGFLDLVQPRSLLDVPVGTGRILDYVRDLDIDVTGLDCTPEMLEEARRVAHPSRHILMAGDASDMSFSDNSFDCLTSLRFFHLFPSCERRRFAEEFMRVVRPQGHIIVSFTNGWYAGGVNWLKKVMRQKTVYFEHKGEVRHLFSKCRILRRAGNRLPKQWLLEPLPVVRALSRKTTTVFPLNLICWETFYLLEVMK